MVALDTMIGPYRLVRKLGEGGMGEVYEALHQTIERQVAIKILHPIYAHSSDIGKRFVNEARAVNLINHPGLVQISDFGQLADGNPRFAELQNGFRRFSIDLISASVRRAQEQGHCTDLDPEQVGAALGLMFESFTAVAWRPTGLGVHIDDEAAITTLSAIWQRTLYGN